MNEDTRIRFIVETPVDLASLPTHAWGRCQKRHGVSEPEIVDGAFVMRQRSADQWVLPVGSIVQLSSDQAAAHIAAGQAERVTDSPTGIGTFHTIEALDREGAA